MIRHALPPTLALLLAACAPLPAPTPPGSPALAPARLDLPTSLGMTDRPAARWVARGGKPVAVAGDRVFSLEDPRVPGKKVVVRAISLADGAIGWSREIDAKWSSDRIQAEVVGDRLVLAGRSGATALATSDGHRLFEHPIAEGSFAVATTAGSAAILCVDGKIRAIDLEDGRSLWTGPCRRVSAHGDLLAATLPEAPGTLPWDERFERVVGLDPRTGRTRWSSAIFARKIQAFEGLVLAEQAHALTALALDSGRELWSLPERSLGTVVLAAGRLIHAAGAAVSALDARSGATLWSVAASPGSAPRGDVPLLDAGATSVIWGAEPFAPGSLQLVRVDAATGRAKQTLALYGPAERLWLAGDDILLGLWGFTARLARDRALPALLRLPERERIDAIVDDPLGDPRTLSGELVSALDRPGGSPAAGLIAARIQTIPEARLPVVLDALVPLHALGAVDALVERFPGVKDPQVRRLFVDVLGALGDARATSALGQALGDRRLGEAASEGLVRIGTHDALARVSAHLDARMREAHRFHPCLTKTEEPCPTAEKDSDGDGWPDALEVELGTAPDRADSDGDGVPDASDPCPLLAGGYPADDLGARLQTAFLSAFEGQPPQIVSFGPSTPSVCFRGAPGPIFHRSKAWLEEHGRPRGAVVSLLADDLRAAPPVEGQRSDVAIGVVYGPLNGAGHAARLVFREGRWFCEELKATWVS